MVTTENAEKPEIELSCRESHLILRTIPLRRQVSEMRDEEIAAIKHYIYCKDCREKGLSEILETKLTCREALQVWAEAAGALWLKCGIGFRGPRCESLIELYATEHVWGKYEWNNRMGGDGWEGFGGCRGKACLALHGYWASVPMSSSAGDGPDGVIHLFPFLIETFKKQNWPLDELLVIQKKRIDRVMQDIKLGNVTVSSGHYHFIDELVEEIRQHVAVLQKSALRVRASSI